MREEERETVCNDGASLQRSHAEKQLWLNTNKTNTQLCGCLSVPALLLCIDVG